MTNFVGQMKMKNGDKLYDTDDTDGVTQID